MKNKLKLLGVIAAVAVIGFSMVGCDNGNGGGGGGGVTMTVINNFTSAITGVDVEGFDDMLFTIRDLNIAPGASQVFTFSMANEVAETPMVEVFASGLTNAIDIPSSTISNGDSMTVTLTNGGDVVVNVVWR